MRITSVTGQQRIMRPLLNNHAVVQHNNAVCVGYRRQPVRNHNGRALLLLHQVVERLLHDATYEPEMRTIAESLAALYGITLNRSVSYHASL